MPPGAVSATSPAEKQHAGASTRPRRDGTEPAAVPFTADSNAIPIRISMTRTAALMTAAILTAGTAQADVCSGLQQQYVAAGGGGYSAAPRGVDVAALNRSLQAAQGAAAANR